MAYVSSGGNTLGFFNGSSGNMGRYSFGANSMYSKINMDEMDDEASQAPGKSMAVQAKAAGYQDMFRNIQAMRDASYAKEKSGGEITSEFSGIRRPGGLGDGFWFH